MSRTGQWRRSDGSGVWSVVWSVVWLVEQVGIRVRDSELGAAGAMKGGEFGRRIREGGMSASSLELGVGRLVGRELGADRQMMSALEKLGQW